MRGAAVVVLVRGGRADGHTRESGVSRDPCYILYSRRTGHGGACAEAQDPVRSVCEAAQKPACVL